MVSTRGIKYRFTEGEKVLCYEPDPTKAKVLYDSKVLEVVETKDKRGRKCVEYLIHFQGWNSSWDRCVGEDFVLKDTEENRQLQRDLAEKSQLQIGAYLYRKERKKRNLKLSERINDSINSGGKVRRGGSSEDGSSSSTFGHQDGDTDDTQHDDGDSETCSSMDNVDSAEDDRVHLELGETMKTFLEQDYEKVKLQNKMHVLPATPNIVTILEGYVKYFAVNQLCVSFPEPPRKMSSPHTKKIKDIDKICRSLNICKEVCDGLRLYFDFTIKDHLLYKQELELHNAVLAGLILPAENTAIKEENISMDEESPVKQEQEEPESPIDLPYSHLSSFEAPIIATPNPIKINEMPSSPLPAPIITLPANTSTNVEAEVQLEPRRLRSHKTEIVENNNILPDILNTLPVKQEMSISSMASISSRSSTPVIHRLSSQPTTPLSSLISTELGISTAGFVTGKSQTILHQVSQWKIIPDELKTKTPPMPALVYGAPHLARLLVKLPDFLCATNIAEDKLKLVTKHLDTFIDYLEQQKDWFNDRYYSDAPVNTE